MLASSSPDSGNDFPALLSCCECAQHTGVNASNAGGDNGLRHPSGNCNHDNHATGGPPETLNALFADAFYNAVNHTTQRLSAMC